MYPQTHVYFAERVFGVLTDALALGSVFPDVAAGICTDRQESHGRGWELLCAPFQDNEVFLNFVLGVISHGINPKGIDFYGDEKYLTYERGYCFEKARPLVKETIRACNLPSEMGWWKAHNIVEMGIELTVGSGRPYGEILQKAFANKELVEKISSRVANFYNRDPQVFYRRIYNFANYIDTSRVTPQSLASHYDIQMFTRHRIHIDVNRVAGLILRAAEIVADDLDEFLRFVSSNLQKTLLDLEKTTGIRLFCAPKAKP
ncbi:MAG: hypothetical protein ACUVSK_10610 [Desulfotomaculales bacterium]